MAGTSKVLIAELLEEPGSGSVVADTDDDGVMCNLVKISEAAKDRETKK
jgi:hypothetical protein